MHEPGLGAFAEYWSIIVRRRRIVLITVLASIVVATILCLVLPRSYRSNTLILVENQKIPEDYVKAVVAGSIEERLTSIQQQVMSRTLLGRVIEEFKLYQKDIARRGLESVIEDMRKTIKVDTVGTHGARGKSVEAFSISFAHEDPMTAMKVTAKLASQFIEENLKVREQLVEGASEFLEQELGTAKVALEAQEQAISQFKTKHMGVLHEQMEANLRALDRMQADLNTAEEMLQTLTERLSLVEKSIKEYETTGTTNAAPGLPSPHVPMDPLVGRLKELERTLAGLTAEYKETYPDVVEVRQEIENVKSRLAAKYGDPAEEKDADAAKTFDPYLRELVKQRNELRVEVAGIKERRHRLTAQIKEYESRVEQTPSREQELMILVRDYENMQKNYQSLLEKRLNARVAGNLEKRQKAETFRMLDPANLPEKAEKPNRVLIMLLGLVLGCGLGVGAAVVLDQLTPTFRSHEDIEAMPGVKMLAAIPDFGIIQQWEDQMARLVGRGAGGPATEGMAVQVARNVRTWFGVERKQAALPPEKNLVVRWRPQSVVAEQYRVAATRLVHLEKGRSSTVVEVTSAVKGEGKTTTAVNLGYTLARDLGKKTLVVDFDLKCPELQKYAIHPPGHGLVAFLNGEVALKECLAKIDESPCWLLAVGRAGDDVNDLAMVQQFHAVLPELLVGFDYVLINTPPILPLAIMNALAGLADVLIMVVRAGATPMRVVERARNGLGAGSQMYMILNAVEALTIPYYMRYGYQKYQTQTTEEQRA